MKLTGKVAIVTGAGSGIGKAIARLFADEGASIAVATLSESGQQTAAEIEAAGGSALFVRCDIADRRDAAELVRRTIEAYGSVDVLVNNAARNRGPAPVPESVAEMPEDHWYATLDTNLSGQFLCSKYALQEMLKRGSGSIINVSSAAGLGGVENLSAYGTSKAALVALTKSMALDYGPKGVRVNAICPGMIETERLLRYLQLYQANEQVRQMQQRVPLLRLGLPEEIARVALFLACDDSSYVTGAIIPVDGGGAARH